MGILFIFLCFQTFCIQNNKPRNKINEKAESDSTTPTYACVGKADLDACKGEIQNLESFPEGEWSWHSQFSQVGMDKTIIFITDAQDIIREFNKIIVTDNGEAIIHGEKVIINQNDINNNIIAQSATSKIIFQSESTGSKCFLLIKCETTSIDFDFKIYFSEYNTNIALKVPQNYPKNMINIEGNSPIYMDTQFLNNADIFNKLDNSLSIEGNNYGHQITFYSDSYDECFNFIDILNKYFTWTDNFETLKEYEKMSQKPLLIAALKPLQISMNDNWQPGIGFYIGRGVTLTLTDIPDQSSIIFYRKYLRTGVEIVGSKSILFDFEDDTSNLILQACDTFILDSHTTFSLSEFVPKVEIQSDKNSIEVIPSLQFNSIITSVDQNYRITIPEGLSITSTLPHYLGTIFGQIQIGSSSTCFYVNEQSKSLCGQLTSNPISEIENIELETKQIVIASSINTTISIPETFSKEQKLFFVSPEKIFCSIDDVSIINYYQNRIELNDKYTIVTGNLLLNTYNVFHSSLSIPDGYHLAGHPVNSIINNMQYGQIYLLIDELSSSTYNFGDLSYIRISNELDYNEDIYSFKIAKIYNCLGNNRVTMVFVNPNSRNKFNQYVDYVNVEKISQNYEATAYTQYNIIKLTKIDSNTPQAILSYDFNSALNALDNLYFANFHIMVCFDFEVPKSISRSLTFTPWHDKIQITVPPPQSIIIKSNNQFHINYVNSILIQISGKMNINFNLENSLAMTVNDNTQSMITFNLLSDVLVSSTNQITADFVINVNLNDYHLYALDITKFGSIFGNKIESSPICAYETDAETICTLSNKKTIESAFQSPFTYSQIELAIQSNSVVLDLPSTSKIVTINIATESATALTINSVSDLKITDDYIMINEFWKFVNNRELLVAKLSKESQISVSNQISKQITLQLTDAESTINLDTFDSQNTKFITLVKFGQSKNTIKIVGSSIQFTNFKNSIVSNEGIEFCFDQTKYLCICKDDSSCNSCKDGFDDAIETVETLDSDPGEKVNLRIFSDIELSSTIFTNEHKVLLNAKLTLNNVLNVYQNIQNQLKVDQLIFSDGNNLLLKPKNSNIEITLGPGEECHEFTIEFSNYLTLKVTNPEENGAIASKITVKGKGELNAFNYPIEKIETDSTVNVIKGVYLICNSQSNNVAGGICSSELYKDYKIIGRFDDFSSNENFDENTKIVIVLNSFSINIEANVNKFSHQPIIFYTDESSIKLLEDVKVKFLSAKILTNKEGRLSELNGSTGGALLNSDDSNRFIVGFDDSLTIKQVGTLEKTTEMTIEPQNKEATIVIDDSVNVENQRIQIQSGNTNQKLNVYVGNKEINDKIKDFIGNPENIQIEINQGKPSDDDPPSSNNSNNDNDDDENTSGSSDNDAIIEIESSSNNDDNGPDEDTKPGSGNGPEENKDPSDKGLSGGQIAGIVIGVIAFVAIVVGIVIFIIYGKKKILNGKNENSNDMDDSF